MVYPRLLWPIVLTASNNVMRVQRPSGAATVDVTIPAGTYYISNDASAVVGQEDLIDAIHDQLVTDAGGTWEVALSAAGTISIRCTSHTFGLIWNSGTCTLYAEIGYDNAGPFTGAQNEWAVAEYQHQGGWYPERSVRFSTGTGPERVVAVGEAVSAKVALGEVSSATSRVEQIGPLVPGKIRTNDPATGVPWVDGAFVPTYLNESFETFWATLSNCADFRWYPDAATVGTYSRMCIKDANFLGRLVDKSVMGGAGGGAARLMYETRELYLVTLPMQHYVV